ncbi:hypothetical protein [Nocardia sp. CNY236]|uniref:hypothetical protein n=1 Tax=Nocardia sp. CNY236 TaxID=1169152 RepID=UPI00040FD9E0|nr:hypothetical protein [Nocardia sp. CNY236]
MAGEITVPALPCRSIDEIVEFYTMLGFTRTYYQIRPNPYVSLKREDLQLAFFGIQGFEAADSYGTCLVIVPDTRELFESFAAGMRAAHGKLLLAGIPRITRPRKRKNANNHSGFTVVDPGGNWIRISAAKPTLEDRHAITGKLSVTLARAVVMGDSHGEHTRAAQILDAALERDSNTATPAELIEALAYRAELAIRAADTAGAAHAVVRARSITLSEAEHSELTETLAFLDDLLPVVENEE